EVTQVTPGGFELAEAQREDPNDPDLSRTAPEAQYFGQPRPAGGDKDPDPSRTAQSDPDLSRTAPVEPGLPGSTAASTSGPIPTTVDKGRGPPPRPHPPAPRQGRRPRPGRPPRRGAPPGPGRARLAPRRQLRGAHRG